jgi:hypothetical protein
VFFTQSMPCELFFLGCLLFINVHHLIGLFVTIFFPRKQEKRISME